MTRYQLVHSQPRLETEIIKLCLATIQEVAILTRYSLLISSAAKTHKNEILFINKGQLPTTPKIDKGYKQHT